MVDDERDIVEIVSNLLQGEGYRTIAAYDGKEALEAITHHKPNGIVLDIRMPVMDGLEVMKRLRSDSALSSTPVVILTASQVSQELEDQLKQLKISSLVTKLFDPTNLLETVSKAVSP